MIVVPPLTITDLLLISSTVAEPFSPANYNGASTYGLGDFSADATLQDVYESLQAGNVGHTPASSPLYWKRVGLKEVAWNSGTTYAASSDSAPVYALYNHRLYMSLQGTNTNKNPYANPDFWEDIGPSQRYAMFDTLRSTAAVGASPLTVVITPGERIDALAVLGVVADTVRVQVTSVAGGGSVYDETATLLTHEVANWYDYFFKGFQQGGSYLFQDIPPFTDAVVTVTFTRATTGNPSCGALCMGLAQDLGIVQKSATNEALNYSITEDDEFGNTYLIQRRIKPKTTQTVTCPSSRVTDIIAIRTALNAVPAVYAGLTDSVGYYFPSLLILGIFTQWTIEAAGPLHATQTIELKEV